MPTGWVPRHENHAIDIMAVVVTLGGPVPEVLLKKAQLRAESTARELGLVSRHHLYPIAVQRPSLFGEPPVTPQVNAVATLMMNAPETDPDRTGNQISEQLQVAADSIAYRCFSYVSWQWQKERVLALMASCFESLSDAAGVASIRLEYLDRFAFDGSPDDAKLDLLLRRGNPLMAQHIFDVGGLWHTHAGSYADTLYGQRGIVQVHLDANDVPFPPVEGVPTRRTIAIVTAREDRFNVGVGPIEPSMVTFDMLGKVLEQMHADLIGTIGDIVTDDVANQIYLKSKKND